MEVMCCERVAMRKQASREKGRRVLFTSVQPTDVVDDNMLLHFPTVIIQTRLMDKENDVQDAVLDWTQRAAAPLEQLDTEDSEATIRLVNDQARLLVLALCPPMEPQRVSEVTARVTTPCAHIDFIVQALSSSLAE